jgi:hypothetical protein
MNVSWPYSTLTWTLFFTNSPASWVSIKINTGWKGEPERFHSDQVSVPWVWDQIVLKMIPYLIWSYRDQTLRITGGTSWSQCTGERRKQKTLWPQCQRHEVLTFCKGLCTILPSLECSPKRIRSTTMTFLPHWLVLVWWLTCHLPQDLHSETRLQDHPWEKKSVEGKDSKVGQSFKQGGQEFGSALLGNI